MKTLSILAFVLSGFVLSAQSGQDDPHLINIGVPAVAILDLESEEGITLTVGPDAPTEAGHAISLNQGTSSNIWLNYSSVKSSSKNPTRDISVALNQPLPGGVTLEVEAAPYSGTGEGSMGSPNGSLSLSKTPQALISGIGSCYTGDGVNNGHQLIYRFTLSPSAAGAYAALNAGDSNPIQVNYTLSDL